ncbi:MAG: hypothetical protein A3H31_12995 [Gallionellales bacterium RIFCSPLOWO2_02_FULL_57_47]|nr:MAG: hypothetical protein A3H31_12995 [Gallionellales bacterium RIFCSPLOWO2_02_FULL_57_47]OGT12906.1 MAG: hypothetical protein A3J49_16940 [Gallionellales bacterium RIFCSPHIGHO2_02_FULL_57_16]
MDSKTVFVRTSKGEDEAHSRTMHLPGDLKRALLMVDGTATCGEITKRAAPSLRASLDAMLQELEKDGYIADKAKAGNIPRMSVPPRMATPHKTQPADDDAGELDFMSGVSASSSKTPADKANKAAADTEKLKAEAEATTRQEIEAAELKAHQEAEAARVKLEQEATRIKAESDASASAEAKAVQEIEASRLHDQQEAEAARLKAEQEVAKAHEESASLKTRQKAESILIQPVQNTDPVKGLSGADKPRLGEATTSRSSIVTVLFFDVVGYTKQSVNRQIEIKKQFNQIVSECLITHGGGEHIILDTGDGAAIGFLQHPEDAMEVAMKFRKTVMANQHLDFPDLKVRIGIHLGPINIVKDMNGQRNMVGDGINDAQRVMSFAGVDQIYISRPYYDFISRLKDEYADMFRYRGMQKDKHGREHPVYEYVGHASEGKAMLSQTSESAAEAQTNLSKPGEFAFDTFQVDEPQSQAKLHKDNQPAQKARPTGTEPAGKQDTFAFDSFQVDVSLPLVEPPKEEKVIPAQQPGNAARAAQPVESRQPVQQEVPALVASKPAGDTPSKEEIHRATQERIAVEKRMQEEALAAKKQAEAQAKARAGAEQRAAEAARAEIEQAAKQVKYSADAAPVVPVAKPASVARVRRKPFSWGKLAGFMLMMGVILLVLLLGALFVAPYVLPTRDYLANVEKLLSAKLDKPVHIGRLSGRILPMPRLELGEIYIGEVKQFQAKQALINFSVTGLFIDAKPIDSIELQGVKVSGAGLQNVSAWMQQLAVDNQYPVARMVVSQGTLDAEAVQLTGVEGVLNFDPLGEFANANLHSNAGKYVLDISATLGNKLKIALTVRDSALPLLPNWHFEELTAKGELSDNDLSISEFDGRILGGILHGKARIAWRSGWRAQGDIVAKTITMQRLNNLLEGNVEGSANFKMAAADLAGLADSVLLEGSFMAKNGVIGGMDIVETARAHSREHLPGGRTHFDELSGDVAYADNTLHFKQTRITTKVLDASATLDIDKQQLSGSITARLALGEGMKPVDLQIGGVIDRPTLRFVP